jgi:hypothetical protein
MASAGQGMADGHFQHLEAENSSPASSGFRVVQSRDCYSTLRQRMPKDPELVEYVAKSVQQEHS